MTTTPFPDVIASGSKLLVRQIKEWTEIFTGFETKNRYGVYAADGAKREIAQIDKPFTWYAGTRTSRTSSARSRTGAWHVPFSANWLKP